MAKKSTNAHYSCIECGQIHGKWFGKCTGCGAWNTLIEEVPQAQSRHALPGLSRPSCSGLSREGGNPSGGSSNASKITDISAEQIKRLSSNIGEFDRVLGGGLVPGGVILLGGEPGVGKSTLLLSTLFQIAKQGKRVLYLSAEESLSQIRLSAERLGALDENLYLLAESNLAVALGEANRLKPDVLVLDSVQTFYLPDVESAPGSMSQIREVAHKIIHLAKDTQMPTYLVGHITKDGNIAGPKMLEHMVDTVLYFENTRSGQYRILRAHKNRFGSTHEMGVFEMQGSGLKEVSNASAFFLKERPEGKPGSAVAISMEGTRPVLIEIQALTVDSPFGNPRRTTQGIDSTRCALLAAVLERRGGLNLAGNDLFVNVAGGATASETASDLPAALAIASSLLNKAIPSDIACFGELGLSGEVRGVAHVDARIQEAEHLGFRKIMLPKGSLKGRNSPKGMEFLEVAHIEQALEFLMRG